MKLPKGVDQLFLDEIQKLSAEDLAQRVFNLQLANAENEEFKEGPEFQAAKAEFDVAKERFDLVAGPVKDLTATIKNKTRLLIARLKEVGGA